MQEEYQSNWFNQKGENKNLTNLFQEAKKQDYNTLISNNFFVDMCKDGQFELVEFLLKLYMDTTFRFLGIQSCMRIQQIIELDQWYSKL